MADTIEDALLALSARDQDYASIHNDMGFNGRDTGFGNSLADQLRNGRKLSFKQKAAAYKMLGTYRGQLARYGIDYGAIPKPVNIEPPKTTVTATLTVEGERVVFRTTGYDQALVQWVKTFPNRRYNPDDKVWSFPLTEAALLLMGSLPDRVTITNPQAIMRLEAERELNRNASAATDADIEVPGLAGELMPFQKAGVAYALENRRVLIGDEMGLGKTIQAIAAIQGGDAYPALVVVPAVVKLNWRREWLKWVPARTVSVLSGRTPDPEQLEAEVVIVNYDVLDGWLPELSKTPWKAIVFDESHYVKNAKAKRTKAAKALAKPVPIRILLTGTPILNRPFELVSQLDVVGLLRNFGGKTAFVNRYCNPTYNGWGWDYSGAAHLDELHHKLRSIGYVRRTKAQVLTELPAKRRAVVPMELDNPERYLETLRSLRQWCRDRVKADEDFMARLSELDLTEAEQVVEWAARKKEEAAMQAEALVKIEALKQVAAEEKLPSVLSWVEDFLESGQKLVVFAHHKNIISIVAKHLQSKAIGAVMVTGETAMEQRQAAVDRFQNDPEVKVFIGNIQAAGVGITLTAASDVVFLELPWRPGDLDQAEDRCHRIGQSDSVTAWYLLAADTIEEKLADMLDQKRQVVDAATDGTVTAAGSMITKLLKDIIEEEAA